MSMLEEMGFKVPSKGIASETCGSVSATKFRNTVSDSKMVTPVTTNYFFCILKVISRTLSAKHLNLNSKLMYV